MKIGGSTDGVGGLRPREPARGPEKAAEAGKAFEAAAAGRTDEAAAAPASSAASGSPKMEELRRMVGAVPTDPEAATMSVVKGLLTAELGPEAAEQPGFEKMAVAVAEKIKQDPVLGDTLKKVLGELARP
jgi:hypothetical protein